MRSLLLGALALALTGCSTMDTHLKTGCIWTCSEWQQRLAENPNMRTPGVGNPNISYSTVSIPSGTYSISTMGNSTVVNQISRTK